MKISWTRSALKDRRDIYAYIETDDPHAAILVDERIAAATTRLVDYPESGRIGRIEGTRELVIARTSYIAPYMIAGSTVRILRVIHGARLWPDAISED